MMRVQLRIVAGSLRGRKLTCQVHSGLRPTPDKVREALFSILGNAVPQRPFFDAFAGTGVIGLEAISRGANFVQFIERDFRLAQDIERQLAEFKVAERGQVVRGDVYRWASHWQPPAEPVNVYLSPPFPDLERRAEDLATVIRTLQERVAEGSVLVLQSERHAFQMHLPDPEAWDQRHYGRNELLLWVKETPDPAANGAADHDAT
jgi:16S rRNA (guanine(966)-N(2))-methyltransferase RsmD